MSSFGEVLSEVFAFVLDWIVFAFQTLFGKFLDAIWVAAQWAGLSEVMEELRYQLVSAAGHAAAAMEQILAFYTVLDAWGIPVIPVGIALAVWVDIVLLFIIVKIVLKLIPTVG